MANRNFAFELLSSLLAAGASIFCAAGSDGARAAGSAVSAAVATTNGSGTPYDTCIQYHRGTEGADISVFASLCNVHLLVSFWVDGQNLTAKGQCVGFPVSCADELGGFGKHSEFDYTGVIHVAACEYPDPPVYDSFGTTAKCPVHSSPVGAGTGVAAITSSQSHAAQIDMRESPPLLRYYPDASRKINEQGDTAVWFCVAADGRLSAVPHVQRSSGYKRLDEAAVKWIAHDRFFPAADQDGKPVASCTALVVRFRLIPPEVAPAGSLIRHPFTQDK